MNSRESRWTVRGKGQAVETVTWALLRGAERGYYARSAEEILALAESARPRYLQKSGQAAGVTECGYQK
ncbi:MAG TPA: hypothetical protein VN939_07450 [Chthoniobacterales bacterium]|jgi:hypothetical protein|nr:hypothetical protein [Chthoniobacterales bacterium]